MKKAASRAAQNPSTYTSLLPFGAGAAVKIGLAGHDYYKITQDIDRYKRYSEHAHYTKNPLAELVTGIEVGQLRSKRVEIAAESTIGAVFDGVDKISWGGTFSLDHRPMLLKSNFRGYNTLFMDPRDYQFSGTTNNVFQFPAEDSKDHYFSDGKMAVPYGLLYRTDNQGNETLNTTSYTSSQEYKGEITMSFGAGFDTPFSHGKVNKSHTKQLEWFNKEANSCTVTKTRETRYALALDKRHMQLDSEFASRIYELRDYRITDPMMPGSLPIPRDTPSDNTYTTGFFSVEDNSGYKLMMPNRLYEMYEAIFDSFGTHYPNAVTYGGMALGEIFHTEQEKMDLTSSSDSIHSSASVGFKLLGGSGTYNHDKKESNTFNSLVVQDRAKFRIFGGSISKGGGWSLGRGEEVPLLLDLRPIHELLSSTFFDDPYIWRELREEMTLAYALYISRKGQDGKDFRTRDSKELRRHRKAFVLDDN
jgi:hypothetical protein